MGFIEEFERRGYFYQCTDLNGLKDLIKSQKIAMYIGFDATAPSLHVGNLMQIMMLRLLQKHGHKPIIIMGGATTKIGDPSGKTEMRKMLSDEQIDSNIQSIKASLSNFISFGSGHSDAIILNNADWLEKLNYLDLLKNFGRFISINKMLTMDSVCSRLEKEDPLTFLEFNYMILQAYDFYHLYQTHDCMVQLGGSDQWGNIIMGVDFIKKALGKPSYGLTAPLLLTAGGKKMGKTESGAVWIDSKLLSPYEYFQFWRNIDDKDVIKFSLLYTEFDDQENKNFEELVKTDINEAKKILAYNITKICHGEMSAQKALTTSVQLFEQRSGNVEDMPTIELAYSKIDNGLTAYGLLVEAKLAESKTAAKNLIRGGGAKINDEKIEDENLKINKEMLVDNRLKLSSGKKKHILVKFLLDIN